MSCIDLIFWTNKSVISNHGVDWSLAEWLSVGLRIKWLWVQVPLQSLKN